MSSEFQSPVKDNSIIDASMVIFELLNEIDEICRANKIEYYLINAFALMAYRKERIGDINSGRILMTAENALKFVAAYNNAEKKDRAVEWLGNNENFPGIFLRYINTNTLYYTNKRIITEKELGMFITIDILRPTGKWELYNRAIENAWMNFSFGYISKGRKWEPKIRKMFEIFCGIFGKKILSKLLVKYFFRAYNTKNMGNLCYIQKDVKKGRRYYPFYMFKNSRDFKIGENYYQTTRYLKKYIIRTYGKYKYKEIELKNFKNNVNHFCDTGISYRELNLSKFHDEIKEISDLLENQKKEEASAKNKRNKCLDIMTRSYYRYYYGFVVFKDIDKLEAWYKEKRFEELDEILLPYLRLAIKYGRKKKSLFINERINKLLYKRYRADVKKIFRRTPADFRTGIKIYDYKGFFLDLIEGK